LRIQLFFMALCTYQLPTLLVHGFRGLRQLITSIGEK
jgi:hypothetical protein